MITEKQQEDIKSLYNSIRDRYDEKMQLMRMDWQKHYKNYRGINSEQKYKGSANLFIQETHNAVETLVSRIKRLVLSTDPPFSMEYEGPLPEDEKSKDMIKQRADIVTNKIAAQLRNARFNQNIEMAIRSMGIYGTTVIKYFWDYRIKEIVRDGQTILVPDYDDVAFKVIDLFNFYPIGEGETVDELHGCMERVETTLRELKENEKRKNKAGDFVGVYENLDKVRPVRLGDEVEYDRKAFRKYDIRLSPDEIDKEEIPVEMFEIWIPFDIDGTGNKVPCVISIANDIVVRLQRNPFYHQRKPYVNCAFIPILNEFYGVGLAELITNDQQHLNDTFNQMCDDATYTLHNMWKRKIGCPTLKNNVFSAPGKIFDVRDPDDLTPLTTAGGAIMNTGIQVIGLIRDNINNTTGAQPILQGQPLRSRTTATEVAGQERHGQARIIDVADRVSERVIKPLIEMVFELDKQFMRNPGFVRLETEAGIVFKKMLLTDLDFDYMFNVVGAMDVENKMVRQQQLIGFLNILRSLPPQAVATPIFNLLRRIWESFGYKDFQQVVPKEVEMIFKQMIGAPDIQQAGQMGQRAGGAGQMPMGAGMQNQIGGMLGEASGGMAL